RSVSTRSSKSYLLRPAISTAPSRDTVNVYSAITLTSESCICGLTCGAHRRADVCPRHAPSPLTLDGLRDRRVEVVAKIEQQTELDLVGVGDPAAGGTDEPAGGGEVFGRFTLSA